MSKARQQSAKGTKTKKPKDDPPSELSVNVGDYIIAYTPASKTRMLYKYAGVTKNNDVRVITTTGSDHTFDINKRNFQIVANLGPEPVYGKVYDVAVEPFIKRRKLNPWGTVTWFRKTLVEEDKAIGEALRCTARTMKQHKLTRVFPILIEIHNNSATRTLGRFIPHQDADRDTIELTLPDWLDTGVLLHTLYHELGHAMWCHRINDRTKALWVETYQDAVQTQHVSKRVLNDIRADLVYKKDIAIARKAGSDTEREVLKATLQWLRKVRRLTPADIDLLIKADDDLRKVWPKTDVVIGSIQETLTKYATKNAEEFFAEAFALILTDQPVPDDVKEAMETTLKQAKGA